MGADVEPRISPAQRQHTQKTVLAGSGFEGGGRVAIGASRKGRIWSHKRGRLNQLTNWCKAMGEKLLDTTVDSDTLLEGTLKAATVSSRPERMPICIEWPEYIYTAPEALWYFELNGEEFALSDVDLQLVSPGPDGPLRFAISVEGESAELELQLFETNGASDFRFVSSDSVRVRRGGGESEEVVSFFDSYPPLFWFSDGSSLEGNQHVELRISGPPFDPSRIEVWDWSDIRIRRESQGKKKDPNTVQARTIQVLLEQERYDILFDDDGKGEAADVVGVRLVRTSSNSRAIEVDFYHCKFSLKDKPGARVDDLYQVCGQAQKSIQWMASPEKRSDLFTHLLRREAKRIDEGSFSRFELGNEEELLTIRDLSGSCPVSLRVFIVQPGLSTEKATQEHLELLSVTETYLMETFQIAFGVIASA